jgi:hypothetical protein
MSMFKGQAVLTVNDAAKFREALGIAPENLNGMPFRAKLRRGVIERRHLSIVRHTTRPDGLSDSQELFKLCSYDAVKESFKTVAWAVRSTVTGDYWVYSQEEW